MSEEEFEKQTLDNLITDLKDIDKYTSFKNGAFIYDLGKYQGTLLVNYIEQLQQRIYKTIEYIQNHQLVFEISSKKQISYWFDMFYKELLEILGDDVSE